MTNFHRNYYDFVWIQFFYDIQNPWNCFHCNIKSSEKSTHDLFSKFSSTTNKILLHNNQTSPCTSNSFLESLANANYAVDKTFCCRTRQTSNFSLRSHYSLEKVSLHKTFTSWFSFHTILALIEDKVRSFVSLLCWSQMLEMFTNLQSNGKLSRISKAITKINL